MDAQPFRLDGKEFWYCDECKKVHKIKVKAEDCCKEEK